MFEAATRLSCICCREAFSLKGFARHLVPVAYGNGHDCPTAYRDRMETIDQSIG
jgi:hypothetical protein